MSVSLSGYDSSTYPWSSLRRLAVATGNRKKGLELVDLLAPLAVEVLTLADFPATPAVEETGETFAANAALKACTQATRLGEWVLADDSGLAVDALNGAPGVYSARFAGPAATDEKNNAHLLALLKVVPTERRGARYVCHVCLADPGGAVRAVAEGYCHGRILAEPRGSEGFGYDPFFEIVECHRTFGELAPAVKACLSHRARAMRALAEIVRRERAREARAAREV